jgi:ATP:ADP antiporter, AAA family
MRDKFRILPGKEAKDRTMVSMFLAQSVFLGIFIGAYDISAYSLLLSTFDQKMMAHGYVLSGFAGIILTSFYIRFRERIQISRLAFINLIIVTLSTLALWTALYFHPEKWIVIVVFILAGPINILTLIGFSTITSRLFSADKNLSGLADTGLLAGIALISFIIPVLISFKFQVYNILLIGGLSVMISTFIQRTLNVQIRLNNAGMNVNSLRPISTIFPSAYRKNKLYSSLARYSVFSVMTAYVILYSFMTITKEQFPVAEEMARFLGLFTGSMMLLTEFIRRVIFLPFIRTYGIKGCLIISPGMIVPITFITIAIGLSMGYAVSTGGYFVFFLLLALNRLLSKSMKDAIEVPSFKNIYSSQQSSIQTEIHNGISYSVNEIGVLLSGIILSVFGFLSFIKIIHFSFLLFFLVLVWIYLARKVYKEYKKSLNKSIERAGDSMLKENNSIQFESFRNRFTGQLFFRTNYFNLIIGDYDVLNSIRNEWYFKELIDYALSKNDLNLLRVLKTISVNAELDERTRQQSDEAIAILQNISTSFNFSKSNDLKSSTTTKVFSETRMPQTSEILSLLRSNSIESKRQAIFLIGKFRLSDLLYLVCECLNTRGLASDAFKVLQSFGAYAEDDLLRYYLIVSGNIRLSKTILQLLAKTCTKGKSGFLYSRLWSNSRQLKEIVVKGLIDCKFVPTNIEKQRLDQLIIEISGIIAWNLSAKIILKESNDNILLNQINIETERWTKFLFNILSVTYGCAPVEIIMLNNKTGSYNNEIANLVFSDSVKSQLIPLLESDSDNVKVKRLSKFFPVKINGRNKLLEDLLNRDYNLTGLWTKACALRCMENIDGPEMAESVIALLFSPEQILQEESVNLMKRTGNEYYLKACNRLPEISRTRMDKIFTGDLDKKDLIFEKVQFLAKCFSEIHEEDLISLACELHFIKKLIDDDNIDSGEGYIIWTIDSDDILDIQINYSGVAGSTARVRSRERTSYYFLTLSAVEEFYFQFPDEAVCVLKYIDDHDCNM